MAIENCIFSPISRCTKENGVEINLLYMLNVIGSFARSSTATYFDDSGLLKIADANQKRFEYDADTGEYLGLLIEESRTNICLQSEHIHDAVWVKTNTIIGIDVFPAPDGNNTAHEIDAIAANATVTQSIVSASADRVFSVWLARKTGTGTVELTIDGGTTWQAVTLTGELTRVSIAQTAVTDPTVGIRITTSGDAVYWWGAQLETGYYETSYIPTTTAAVTRSADIATIPTFPWFNNEEGSFYLKIRQNAPDGVTRRAISVHNGFSNRMALFMHSSTATRMDLFVNDAGVAQANVVSNDLIANKENSLSFSYKLNDIRFVINGGTVGSDTVATIPTVTTVNIGSSAGSTSMFNGHIKEIKYQRIARENSFLQSVTS